PIAEGEVAAEMRPRRVEIERERAGRRALADVEREVIEGETPSATGELPGEFERTHIAARRPIARADAAHQRGEARMLDVEVERHMRARRCRAAGDMRAAAEDGEIGGAGERLFRPTQIAAEAELAIGPSRIKA